MQQSVKGLSSGSQALLLNRRPAFSKLASRACPSNSTRTRGRFCVRANIFESMDQWNKEMGKKARTMRFEARDRKKELTKKVMENPAVTAVLNVLAVVREKLDPLFVLGAIMWDKLHEFDKGLEDFAMAECKRQWKWKRHNEAEIKFWIGFLEFIRGMMYTFLYQLFVPPSFLRAILFPMIVGFLLNDTFFKSPQAGGVYLAVPYKFWTTGTFTWI